MDGYNQVELGSTYPLYKSTTVITYQMHPQSHSGCFVGEPAHGMSEIQVFIVIYWKFIETSANCWNSTQIKS